MEIEVLCGLVVLWLVWNEWRYQSLRDEVDTLKEKTTEILNAYYEEIGYLKDALQETRN